MDLYKNLAWFAGGVLFGSAGFKLLGSRDAKKVYVQATAAALRMKECAMVAATTVQENAADILAVASDINAQRAARAEGVEDTSSSGCAAVVRPRRGRAWALSFSWRQSKDEK